MNYKSFMRQLTLIFCIHIIKNSVTFVLHSKYLFGRYFGMTFEHFLKLELRISILNLKNKKHVF